MYCYLLQIFVILTVFLAFAGSKTM